MVGGARTSRREVSAHRAGGVEDDRLEGKSWPLVKRGAREARLICLQGLPVCRALWPRGTGDVRSSELRSVWSVCLGSSLYSYLVPLASAARAVSPAFLRSPSAGRRSSVATPVESATPAGSNSRLAMQGRDDRETRGSELIACKISCLARSVSQCACCVPEQYVPRDRAESWIEWNNQCSVVVNGGTAEALQVMYAIMH
jgi:hypothetical protein